MAPPPVDENLMKPLKPTMESSVAYYHSDGYNSMHRLHKSRKMHGVKRVIVFCILIVILPATLIIIPLYLRKIVFADVVYMVAESDIIEIRDGISSVFCQQHSLRMSSSFNAFQLRSRPEVSTNRKHIRLKKSMTLPDDTLEYWGFYLLKGAIVHLKFCSRYKGSRILVVKGERNLRTCGLMDHNKNKVGANYAQGHEKVKVFFEDLEEIHMEPKNRSTKEMGAEKNSERYAIDDDELENHASEDLSEEGEGDFKQPTKNGLLAIDENKTDIISSNSLVNDRPTSGKPRASHRRHRRHQLHQNEQRKKQVYEGLYKTDPSRRQKRDHVYDRKYSHGGNAVNFTEDDESTSISSFENGLFECYDGEILLTDKFDPSPTCENVTFLENGSHRMMSKHEVIEDGYYYYIFYSDNDLVRNDIHAIFDIYKPTFQYSNLTDSQGCVNSTNCTFPINFLSDEIVVVEVPTRDGIEHDEDDISYLISTCHPRTHIYAIFPISVLIIILSCAFL